MDEIDHTHTPLIVCPYCGCEDQESWEWKNGDEADDDIECSECGKEFSCSRSVQVTYSTSKPVIQQLNPRQQENVRAILARIGNYTPSEPIAFIAFDCEGFYPGT